MKSLLKLEEAAILLLCIAALIYLKASWWWYPLLLLGPDISMLGYLAGAKTGAFTYNLFHHKALGAVLLGAGFYFNHQWLLFAGLILLGHSSLDRIFGYGLKYPDAFEHTHLGTIGRHKKHI